MNSSDALPPRSGSEVIRRALEILRDRIPPSWSMKTSPEADTDRSAGAPITLTAPDGRHVTLVLEPKNLLEGRDVAGVTEQLRRYVHEMPDAQGVLVARYLSPPVRTRLSQSGVSFVDATGNVRLEVASPGIFIADRGADADPWRGPGRPRGTLKGAPAAKAVRAIADFSGDWSVRELVDVAKLSTGAGYRIVEFLEREGLAERRSNGRIAIPHWADVLRRWSEDFGFVRSNTVTRWIAARGLDALLTRMSGADFDGYAVTGTIAAAEWAPYAPARSAMIYTTDPSAAATAWGLKPTEAGANVMLAEPQIDVPLVRTITNVRGLRLAAPSQVVVDLMTGPGRSPQEAEELLQWMLAHEQSWRK